MKKIREFYSLYTSTDTVTPSTVRQTCNVGHMMMLVVIVKTEVARTVETVKSESGGWSGQ